jgi:2,4-dienoyl-CoA reductase-like NADH-dependent reductase (Old Yellow Enzyme family)
MAWDVYLAVISADMIFIPEEGLAIIADPLEMTGADLTDMMIDFARAAELASQDFQDSTK